MLEFYHNINSVCAQKVWIALKEKGQEDWAPFRNLASDSCPKVQQMLKAA